MFSESVIEKFPFLVIMVYFFTINLVSCKRIVLTRSCGILQVREAQLAQYNYILVVGEEEANTGQVFPFSLSH